MKGVSLAALAAGVSLVVAAPAAAEWLPHPADATWTYEWTDSAYATTPTKEKVTVKQAGSNTFTLAWTTAGLDNPGGSIGSSGEMVFLNGSVGIENTDWSSSPPPSSFPVLCPQRPSCNNSLSSTPYLLIWGSRSPVLVEPLLSGASWAGTGGAAGDVTSTSTYVGREPVTVPAFPGPVLASKVRSEITQAGALGDPYGSGVRTVWWVYGVGPVKVVFEHAGGTNTPVTTSMLLSTNQMPKQAPADANYFPLVKGSKSTYRWTNTKHLKKPAVQRVKVDEVVNGSARLTVESVSGPIKVAGSYGYTVRTDGVTNIWGLTKAASLATFPALGPRALPKDKRRHFVTPLDLLNFGFNPILTATPAKGEKWGSRAGRDFSIYGVTGFSEVLGIRRVKTPAGTFNALVVQSQLTQRGFSFGSGTRTSYFAPGRGLVKLVFRHGDGSTSAVELMR